MREDKEKAFEMRRAGSSYKEIRNVLGVPLGTLSAWFGGHEWSRGLAEKLSERKITPTELRKIRGQKLQSLYEKGRKEAAAEYAAFKNSPLFIAGLVAYWGEGDKASKYRCRIANTDPGIIRLYVNFLLTVCAVPREKITASLLIYPDLNESACVEYWANETGIPKDRFRKTMVVKGRHPTKRLTYGVCYVVVSSRYLKEKMLVWLRLLGQEFPKMRS